MWGLEGYVRQCGLEASLLELVKLGASQINGCACFVDMHTGDARAQGKQEQRLCALFAWEETPFFTERERVSTCVDRGDEDRRRTCSGFRLRTCPPAF